MKRNFLRLCAVMFILFCYALVGGIEVHSATIQPKAWTGSQKNCYKLMDKFWYEMEDLGYKCSINKASQTGDFVDVRCEFMVDGTSKSVIGFAKCDSGYLTVTGYNK